MLTRIWLWILFSLGLDPRGIFVFYDGRRWRRVDPFVIYRGIYEVDGLDPETALKTLNQGDTRQKLANVAKVAAAVRRVFGISALDDNGRGLTDLECAQLLGDFFDYSDDLKKSIEPQPSCHPSLESLPLGISPSEFASRCGSTSTVADDKAASPSDSES